MKSRTICDCILPCIINIIIATYNICFLVEHSIVQTLHCHPFVRQFHPLQITLSEVSIAIHILSQTKITNFEVTICLIIIIIAFAWNISCNI